MPKSLAIMAGKLTPLPNDPDGAVVQSDQGDLTSPALHYARQGVAIELRILGIYYKGLKSTLQELRDMQARPPGCAGFPDLGVSLQGNRDRGLQPCLQAFPRAACRPCGDLMPDTRRPGRGYLFTLLAGIAALIIVHGIGRFAYTPILPLMRESGLSLQHGGWLAAAITSATCSGRCLPCSPQATASAACGWACWSVWPPRRRWAGCRAGCPVALRFISGLSNGVVFVYSANLVLQHLLLARKAEWEAYCIPGVGAGICLSGVLVLLIDHAGWGWQVAWQWLAAICLLLLCLAWQMREPACCRRPARWPTATAGRAVCAGSGRPGCAGLGYIVSMTFLPAIIRATPGLEGFAAGAG